MIADDLDISIHALRKESDDASMIIFAVGLLISIHALRKESDTSLVLVQSSGSIFQSTLSVRRATVQLDIFVHFLRRKPAAWL